MILYFHKLVESEQDCISDDMPVSSFRKGILSLLAEGYSFVSLSDYLRSSAGEKENLVTVTFDDAHHSIVKYVEVIEELDIPIMVFCPFFNVKNGWAVDEAKLSSEHSFLRKVYKQSGVLFRWVCAPFIPSGFYSKCLTFDDLDFLYKRLGDNFSIGGHGAFHIKHSVINSISVLLEVGLSRAAFKGRKGFCNFYSYPYGHYSSVSKSIVKKFGYRYGISTESGGEDDMCIRRINGKTMLSRFFSEGLK
ncbi:MULTISPECIES: polysaccharide deacetylase family protein [Halomonas]|uniref:NodB homology domain-containing protein n=1 Tax=Halomonas halophila TaxID=29573 RepID=A0ABQ0U7G3_9GAMM|nr:MULTISPECIES: polysaccharide deacetylase family protein [Halomonas]MDR5890199.1 polysaccharide deacetylase family protein [Halomonas salina]WJY05882.1 polysaccharide deacetylase family protein [Halomonas halophila]GEK73663.1 hypothetical protein HHA04nite_22070 [Halomonas halophila]